jgi:hypothetical protein
MIDLNEIRKSVATLKRMGIEIDSFHCSPEVMAEIISEGIAFHSVVTVDIPDDGRDEAHRFRPHTLCGIPIEQRV